MKRKQRKQKLTKQLKNTNRQQLERQTKKAVSEANARLKSLQRHYKKGTWSSKTFAKRLSSAGLKAWNMQTGKVKMRKNLTATQLVAINKAVNQFLQSKTSTRKGIEDVRRKQIEDIQKRKKYEEDIDLSDEDAESLYEIFGDEDFNRLTDKIPSSALRAAVEDAIQENDREDKFIQRLEWYSSVEMNDLDMRESAIRLYNKYVL